MARMSLFFAAILTLLATVASTTSLPQISAVGSKFFTKDGDQFFIKGCAAKDLHINTRKLIDVGNRIAYQLVSTDPLLDEEQCKRDAASMQKLGANTIRVYHVDPTGDHDGCMSAFEDAGIYLFVDLDTFDTQINQVCPSQV